MEYQDIFNCLNDERFKSKLISIYLNDNSIMFEDVVCDCYLHFKENAIEFTEENLLDFLKEYTRKTSKYKSYTLIDNIEDNSTLEQIEKDEEIELDNIYLNKLSVFNLTEEEILCILYLRNENNIKNYDYSFVLRKNNTGIDRNKISKYYENIIKKLLKNITKELI